VPTFDATITEKATGRLATHTITAESLEAVADRIDVSRFSIDKITPRDVAAPPRAETPDPLASMAATLVSIETTLTRLRRSLSLSVFFGVFVALILFALLGAVFVVVLSPLLRPI
jgi:uncharacterized membrane protein